MKKMLKRSKHVKEVVHVKAKKYNGYYNPESKNFAVDPHVTGYEDIRKILQEAFLISDFHISYLCRDDTGENIYLSMLTEWDLDAAFMTSSDPHLRLKVDVNPFSTVDLHKSHSALTFSQSESPTKSFGIVDALENSLNINNAFQVSKSWMSSVVSALNRSTFNQYIDNGSSKSFFPAKESLDDAEFRRFMDPKGRLLNCEDLWLRIYHSGIKPSLRKVAWRVLLNVFPRNLTGEQRIKYMKKKSLEYQLLKDVWKSKINEEWVSQISSMVTKDVLRTDRTYSFFSGPDNSANIVALHDILLTYALTHPDISYCQGMSDIASPLLSVMDNEAHAYICFCSLMQRLQNNFMDDGTVMSLKFQHLALLTRHYDGAFYEYLKDLSAESMYFCYRWLLLEMKREFSFENALIVLEVMWSSLPPNPPGDEGLNLGSYNFQPNKNSPLSLCAKSLNNLSFKDNNETLNQSLYTTDNQSSSIKKQSSVSYINCQTHNKSLPEKSENIPSGIWSCNEDTSSHKLEFKEAVFNTKSSQDPVSDSVIIPPPEELGCGNPFLMFICLAVLLNEKEYLMSTQLEYDDLVMHFDKLVRKHEPGKVLSKAMDLFASYLKSFSVNDDVMTL